MINSPDFVAKHRLSETAFTRQRKLPFAHLVVFLLNLVKGSLQQELDSFFQVLQGDEVPLYPVVGKAAFSKARKQLSAQAFVELNQNVLQVVYEQTPWQRWNGFRVCAVDGSKCRLPDEIALRKHFGVQENDQAHEACPRQPWCRVAMTSSRQSADRHSDCATFGR